MGAEPDLDQFFTSNRYNKRIASLFSIQVTMTDYIQKPLFDEESQHGVLVAPDEPELQPPSMFQVLLLNDDYTPMDFVVEVLEDFFAMSREKATQTMLRIHTSGQALCGIYTRDVAETKALQVSQYARECEHPLQCEVKRDD